MIGGNVTSDSPRSRPGTVLALAKKAWKHPALRRQDRGAKGLEETIEDVLPGGVPSSGWINLPDLPGCFCVAAGAGSRGAYTTTDVWVVRLSRSGVGVPLLWSTPVAVDPEQVSHHPLVASRALLTGKVRALPSAVGVRAPTSSLSKGTLDTLMSVADALFSGDAGPPPAERIAWLRAELSDFMSRSTFAGRALFTLAGFVIGWLLPLSIQSAPPFRRLSLSQRVAALTKMESGRAAPLLIAVRALMCLMYYEHPDAGLELGVDTKGPAAGALYEAESASGASS